MRKNFVAHTFIVLTLILCSIITTPALAKYSGGTGEPNDPYQIADFNDLMTLRADSNDWDRSFILTADIDLDPNLPGRMVFTTAVIAYDTDQDSTFDGIEFTGNFDGNDYTISNLTIDTNGLKNYYLGLFGRIERSSICNLSIKDFNIIGYNESYNFGGICGYSDQSSINNCHSTNVVITANDSKNVGGMIGYNYYANVTNCHSTGQIQADENVGGLIGYNHYGNVLNCSACCNVVADSSAGGLIGESDSPFIETFPHFNPRGPKSHAIINACFSSGSVTGTGYGIGGLIGNNIRGLVSNCYSEANVQGYKDVGGLIGFNSCEGTIVNSYSNGSVIGEPYIGGVVADSLGVVHNSFWDIQTSGINSSRSGLGKTTAQLKTRDTFRGWAWGDVWILDDFNDYPRLHWQNTPGTPLTDLTRPYNTGTGEPNDPYIIENSYHLASIGKYIQDYNCCYKLQNNIDLTDYNELTLTKIGLNFIPFNGTFDGNNMTLSNLHNKYWDTSFGGLFGHLGSPALVENLNLENWQVKGFNYLSILAGLNYGSIKNCNVSGEVEGFQYVAGVAGYNYLGVIENTHFQGSVISYDAAGGITALNNDGKISDCSAEGYVESQQLVGGIAGWNLDEVSWDALYPTISSSSSNVELVCTGSRYDGDYAGGITGLNSGLIEYCVADGNVTGHYYIGGLCGRNIFKIINCYATGSVTGGNDSDYLGGLCGYNEYQITNSYATGLVTVPVPSGPFSYPSSNYYGGLCGYNSRTVTNSYFLLGAGRNNGIGTPLTDLQMKNQASFICWDFLGEYTDGTNNFWNIEPNSYPVLSYISSTYQFQGDGTQLDPYLIFDANDLGAIWQKNNAHFKLVNNIDLNRILWSVAVVPIFTGNFDGNNQSITNLVIDANYTGNGCLGLFGRLKENSVAKDLGIEDVNIIGRDNSWYIGGLCGTCDGSITNCYTTGLVNVGNNSREIGGLCGWHYEGLIKNSYSAICIKGGDLSNWFGSLCGCNRDKIINCFATGSITVGVDSEYIGGLCGYNYGPISNSYAIGSVNTGDNPYGVGGICGYSSDEIINCYAAGSITIGADPQYLGGLCGDCRDDITNCYFLDTVGPDNGYGSPLTDLQMKSQSCFEGWDFVGQIVNGSDDNWRMCVDEVEYPKLYWQFPMTDFLCPDGVNFIDYAYFMSLWNTPDPNADFDLSGLVDPNDLAILSRDWLTGF